MMSLGSGKGAGGGNEVGEGLERSLDRSGTSLGSGKGAGTSLGSGGGAETSMGSRSGKGNGDAFGHVVWACQGCPATSPYPSDKASTSAPGPESTRGSCDSCVTGSCIATELRKTEQVTVFVGA